jgi:hypothetical protein
MLKYSWQCCALMATLFSAGWADAQPNSSGTGAPTQASDTGQCILAGRINSDGNWAPLAQGLQLMDAAGQMTSGTATVALDAIKEVRISKPALLARCQNKEPMANGDPSSGRKSAAPAVKAGSQALPVLAASVLPSRSGGQWVELRLSVPGERIVQVTR